VWRFVVAQQTQGSGCLTAAQSLTKQQTKQSSLGDGAGGKRFGRVGPPTGRRLVVDVIADRESDKNVAVQKDCHSSSTAVRTISVVIGVSKAHQRQAGYGVYPHPITFRLGA